MNTATVSLAVTPTVVSTLISHYFNRKPLRQRPTAHLSYDEGLQLIRSFLEYSSHHTIEELQAFTGQWVPTPQWVKVDEVIIDKTFLERAAIVLQDQLGNDGIERVGGERWWQWRKDISLTAEWIDMRADFNERRKTKEPCQRVMLYFHGGAYYFGSVDVHRYQLQRHARKLKARVLAPEYRLAPQFPFPCALQDCLATYLYLLETQDPQTIVLAGDSAGGGLVMSLLVTLRDRDLPLPAGAVLLSPWVDLTHSFPSVSSNDSTFDYVPQSGFHHKPSKAWPPPSEDQLVEVRRATAKKHKAAGKSPARENGSSSPKASNNSATHLSGDASHRCVKVTLGQDKTINLKDQLQIYTTNDLLTHPLVSPVLQTTLGGLPPLLIMVGGGEILRDEQVYLAHKCANPLKYAPPEESLDEEERLKVRKYRPTDVQLQVWEDLCHVAPTLSFTRPAKYMYRSVAQFSAWVLARAQRTGIDILDDDEISVISSSGSENNETEAGKEMPTTSSEHPPKSDADLPTQIGKAGNPLPPFKNHMIRQRVSRHGNIFPLEPEDDLDACKMDQSEVGVIKPGPVRKWLDARSQWDKRFAAAKARIHRKRIKEAKAGYEGFGEGENPPPSALAGRRRLGEEPGGEWRWKKTKSFGLALWSLWGSKHDEMTVERENKAGKGVVEDGSGVGVGVGCVMDWVGTNGSGSMRSVNTPEDGGVADDGGGDAVEGKGKDTRLGERGRRPSRRKIVFDDHQTNSDAEEQQRERARSIATAARPAAAKSKEGTVVKGEEEAESLSSGLLNPHIDMGASGKRPHVDGIAMPFSVHKEAETASMITLSSNVGDKGLAEGSRAPSVDSRSRPQSIEVSAVEGGSRPVSGVGTQGLGEEGVVDIGVAGRRPRIGGIAMPFSLGRRETDSASMITLDSVAGQSVRSPKVGGLGSPLSGDWTGFDLAGVNGDGGVRKNVVSGKEVEKGGKGEKEDGKMGLEQYVTAEAIPKITTTAPGEDEKGDVDGMDEKIGDVLNGEKGKGVVLEKEVPGVEVKN